MLKQCNSTHNCLFPSNWRRLLAPRVAKGFNETNKKMESKGSRRAMCIARRLMKFDGVFGPRLRRCVFVSLVFGLKSYVACFIIQSKLQNEFYLIK